LFLHVFDGGNGLVVGEPGIVVTLFEG
jgi:hypothetical protein